LRFGRFEDYGAPPMNVSPTQRLVNYLREFPPVRPLDRPTGAPATEPSDRAKAAAATRAAEPLPRAATSAPRPTTPADGAPRRLLPRGSLVNIVT